MDLTGLSVLLLAGLVHSDQAISGKTGVSDGVLPIEEIQVTARKRQENIKDIPAAISLISAADIRRSGAYTLNDIASIIPNVTIAAGQGQTTSSIFIRGVGQSDALQTFEQGVTVYMDGVPLPRMQGLDRRLFDVASIEVLRGPQGTLFGKNAVGGAINITTKAPTEVFSAQVEGRIGTADHRQLNATLSGPLSDQMGVVASFLYSNRDGYYQDRITGKDYADDDTFTGRVKLAADVTDQVKLTFIGDYTDADRAPSPQRAEDDVFITDFVLGQVQVYSRPAGDFTGDLNLSLSDDAVEKMKNKGLAAVLEADLSDRWSLRNITSFRELNSVMRWDVDGTDSVILDILATWDQKQWSNEFQLHYKGDRLDTIFGAFYMDEESFGSQYTDLNDLLQSNGVPLGFTQPGEDRHDTKSYALFAHSRYQLSDVLALEAGIRWSEDGKSFYRVSTQTLGGVETARFVYDEKDQWDNITPTFALHYQMTDQHVLFGRVAKGFKSGGFNGRLSSPGDAETFRPEKVWTYELGSKHTFDWGRVNLAAFYSDYTDYQTRISRFSDVSDPSQGFNFPTVNAADLTIYGVETDFTAQIGALTLQGQVGLLDSDYGSFMDDSGDRSFNKPVFSPSVTAALTALYHVDLGDQSGLDFTATVTHSGGYYLTVENSDFLYQPSYQKVNASVQWQQKGGVYLQAGVNNLTDEIVMQGALELSRVANIQNAYYGNPRHWYVAAGIKF